MAKLKADTTFGNAQCDKSNLEEMIPGKMATFHLTLEEALKLRLALDAVVLKLRLALDVVVLKLNRYNRHSAEARRARVALRYTTEDMHFAVYEKKQSRAR